jgi:hypothetical protein
MRCSHDRCRWSDGFPTDIGAMLPTVMGTDGMVLIVKLDET